METAEYKGLDSALESLNQNRNGKWTKTNHPEVAGKIEGVDIRNTEFIGLSKNHRTFVQERSTDSLLDDRVERRLQNMSWVSRLLFGWFIRKEEEGILKGQKASVRDGSWHSIEQDDDGLKGLSSTKIRNDISNYPRYGEYEYVSLSPVATSS